MTNVNYTLVEETRPIKHARVTNPKGFWDLIVNKNKKGTAIRISSRTGESAVNIAVSNVDGLIKALQDVKARGVAQSVQELPFTPARRTASR